MCLIQVTLTEKLPIKININFYGPPDVNALRVYKITWENYYGGISVANDVLACVDVVGIFIGVLVFSRLWSGCCY